MAWAEADSLANRVSAISQAGPAAAFKQWVADIVAGDYDEAAVAQVGEWVGIEIVTAATAVTVTVLLPPPLPPPPPPPPPPP